jgi:hypothetical protein
VLVPAGKARYQRACGLLRFTRLLHRLTPRFPAMDNENIIQLFARYCDACDRPIVRGSLYVDVQTPLGLRSVHKGCMGGTEREPDPTPGGTPAALAA